MTTEVFRALLADTISTMSKEELRNIIMNTPDKDLGAVGKVVLAEKGRKGKKVEEEGKKVESEEGKVIENPVGEVGNPPARIVAKVKPPKKTIPALGLEKERAASAVLSAGEGHFGCEKGKHSIIDLTMDDLEHREPAPDLLRPSGEPRPAYQKINVAWWTYMLMRLRGHDKLRLHQLATIMDNMVEWSLIQSTEDLITALFQGEIKMGDDRSNWNPASTITSRADMEEYVKAHIDRLLNHPMFAEAYDHLGGNSQDTTLNPGPSTVGNHTVMPSKRPAISAPSSVSEAETIADPSTPPLFNWAAVEKHLQSVDSTERNAWYNKISKTFSVALDDLILQCDPSHPHDKVGIQVLAQLIVTMDSLADNMVIAPDDIQSNLCRDPIHKLRQCMSSICAAIAKLDRPDFLAGMGQIKSQALGRKLRSVDTILMRVFSGQNKTHMESGMNKVIHCF